MPKIASINEACCSGTCLQGEIDADYNRLLERLGPPCKGFDSYKSDAEWIIEFEGGSIATIYNWKDGKNYLGEGGLDLCDIKEWHVGGRSKEVVAWVDDLINNSWPVFDDIRQEAQF